MASNTAEFIIKLSNDKFVSGAKEAAKAFDDTSKSIVEGADIASKAIGQTSKDAKKLADDLVAAKLAGQAIGAGFLAAGGAAALGAVAFSNYTQKLAEVNTLVGLAPDKLKVFSDEIRKSSVELGRSAEESTQAIYNIISSGVDYSKSIEVMALSTKAAVAGVTDTNSAAQVGLAVINSYGLEIDQLEHVYDVLFKTVKDGVTTLPELSASLGNVLPSAAAAGVGLEEVTAAIASMTKSGIRTPLAVTALNGAITALAAPAPEAKKKLDEMGITWKGLTATLGDISKLKLTVAQMREIIPDTEARKAVLALTNNFEGLKVSIEGMQNSSGAMAEAYAIMRETPEEAMKRFQAAIGNLFLSLGELVTGLQPVVETGTEVVKVLNQLPGPLQAIIVLMGAGATASAAYAIATFKIADATRLAGLVMPILTANVTSANVAAAAGAVTNATLSASLTGVATAARTALVALGPIAGIAIAAGVAMNELQKTIDIANAELNKMDKSAANVGNVSKEFDDLKAKLASLGYEQTQLFDDLQGTKLKLMQAAGAGADIDSGAAKKMIDNARARVNEIETLEKKLEGAKKALGEAEVTANKAKLDNMTAQERLFVDNVKTLSGEALEKKKADAQKELEAISKKLTDSLAAEATTAGKISQLQEARSNKAISIEDKIRAKKRESLSEDSQQSDMRIQIDEKIMASQAKLNEFIQTGNQASLESAQRLASDAESLADSLKEPAESANQLKDIGAVFSQISDAELAALQKTKAEQEAKTQSYKEQKAEIEKLLEAINTTQTLTIQADTEKATADIKTLEAEIAKLKDKTITITAKTVQTGPGFQNGGPVLKYANGGPLPGYGGGDRIPILAEGGEYIFDKSRVRELGGMAAMRQLHKGLDANAIKAFLSSGSKIRGYKDGGPVETFEIRMGGAAIRSTSQRHNVISFIDALTRERP